MLSLPGPSSKDMSAFEFAEHLYAGATGEDVLSRCITAPFICKGSVHTVFVVTFECMAELLGTHSTGPLKEFAIQIIATGAQRMGIHSIPAPPIPSGPGAPIKVPVWNSWISLGKSPDPDHIMPVQSLTSHEKTLYASQRAQDVAELAHVDANWSTLDTTLSMLPSLLNWNVLPDNWAIPDQATDNVLDYLVEYLIRVKGC